MKVLPSLGEVREIAALGKYNILPLSCEILSDFTTPIETMRVLQNVSQHCYMLESAVADDKWGRYTFLGYDPKMEITCIGGEIKSGGVKERTERPSDYIRKILAEYKSPALPVFRPLREGLWDIFLMIILVTASLQCAAMLRIRRLLRIST